MDAIVTYSIKLLFEPLFFELNIPHINGVKRHKYTPSLFNLNKKFLKINPTGTVPVLLHKGFPIYESHEQIKYIESQSASYLSKNDIVDSWIKRGSLLGEPDKDFDIYAGNCIAILTPPLFISMLKDIPPEK